MVASLDADNIKSMQGENLDKLFAFEIRSLGIVRQLYAELPQSLHTHMAPFPLQGKARLLHGRVPLICRATWPANGSPVEREQRPQNTLLNHAR